MQDSAGIWDPVDPDFEPGGAEGTPQERDTHAVAIADGCIDAESPIGRPAAYAAADVASTGRMAARQRPSGTRALPCRRPGEAAAPGAAPGFGRLGDGDLAGAEASLLLRLQRAMRRWLERRRPRCSMASRA